MPSLEYHTVDAFSARPFGGNPAAVIVLPPAGESTRPSDDQLQALAAEFNLAETAFATPLEDCSTANPHFNLRWMTPETEVDLCGHATLATAKVLFSEGSYTDTIRFETRSGTLTVRRTAEDKISMDFPAQRLESTATEGDKFDQVRTAVEKAAPDLKGQVRKVAWSSFGPIVEIDKAVNIEGIAVDVAYFTKDVAAFLLILTQPSASEEHDVYSRVFAPAVGISEDPVTGAAHTVIAPYWRSSSQTKLAFANSGADSVLRCRQVSRRGGNIEVAYNEEKGRVELVGEGRLMMKGTITF